MKKILAVTLALAATTSAFADRLMDTYGSQRQESGNTSVPMAAQGSRHMIEFNAANAPSLILGFKRDKNPGSDANSGTDLKLQGGYAYGVTRFLQVGARFSYDSTLSGGSDREILTAQVGGILNSDTDFTRAAYLSAYIGAGYDQNFGNGGRREDLRLGTLALGKRMPLDQWGIKHVVYSPEVALTTTNSTTNKNFDYRQALEIRVLQFSAFF